MQQSPLVLEAFLYPPACVFSVLTGFRNFAYDRGWLAVHRVDTPIISVGNLTVGGTGKTPVAALLVQEFLNRGVSPGIVSRGYKSRVKGVAQVRPDDVDQFGDEPSWLASKFPQVPVYVGTDRVAACQELKDRHHVQVILLDDGFQHRRLQRLMNIVVVDATEPRWHYRPLPLGRARESFASLQRADAVFLTKVNLALDTDIEWLNRQVQSESKRCGKTIPLFEFQYEIFQFGSLGFGETAQGSVSEMNSLGSAVSPKRFSQKRLLLVSGIGRPRSFQNAVAMSTGAEIVDHLIYPDHHRYDSRDIETIERRADSVNADAIIVTEKDAVKLRQWSPRFEVWQSHLRLSAKSELGAFYELVDRLVF